MDAFIDNASVAGAGRALYEDKPDISDIIGLSHVLTACVLFDNVILDGSSRYLRMPIKETGYTRHMYPAIWTWERKYPALEKLDLKDVWLGPRYERFIGPIAEYLCKLSRPLSEFLIDQKLIESIPSAYKSPGYFDLAVLKDIKTKVEREIGYSLSQEQFLFVIYAWRGIYYHESSKSEKITYFPNPERQRVIENILLPGDLITEYSPYAMNFLIETLSSPRIKLLKKMKLDKEKEYQMNVPPIFAYLLSNCKSSREEIIPKTLELRNSPECENLREWLTEYDNAYRNEHDLQKLERMTNEVNKSFQKLSKRLGIDDPKSIKITPILPLGVFGQVQIEDILNINIPSGIYSELFQKKYLTLLWRISRATLVNGFPSDLLKLSPIACSSDNVKLVFISTPNFHIDPDKDLPNDVKIRGMSAGETHEKSFRKY